MKSELRKDARKISQWEEEVIQKIWHFQLCYVKKQKTKKERHTTKAKNSKLEKFQKRLEKKTTLTDILNPLLILLIILNSLNDYQLTENTQKNFLRRKPRKGSRNEERQKIFSKKFLNQVIHKLLK